MAANDPKQPLVAIGSISTPYTSLADCPRNIGHSDELCRIEVFEPYVRGLDGLKQGDRIELLYWLDRSNFTDLIRTSRKTGERKGIFALRTPHRPNPIGTAVVQIDAVTKTGLTVRGLDCLSGTTLLDIKPAFRRRD